MNYPSPKAQPDTSRSRIAALDGYRAVAVLFVVAFHYLSDLALRSKPTLYPFGDAYAQIPWLKHGNLGVDLFFMVSGFVIAMTLESSRGPVDFAVKRLARLLPSMLLCSVITYLFLKALPQAPWQVAPIDFVPGWTFISEHTWTAWLGTPVGLVDTVYWTLFVEAKFYVIAALLYFGLRRAPLLLSLGVMMNITWVVVRLPADWLGPALLETVKAWTLWNHLPLFVAGVAFHCLQRGTYKRLALVIVLETAAMVVARSKLDPAVIGFYVLFFGLFLGLVFRPQWVRAFAWAPMAAIGASSYVFYLLHNRIGVTTTHLIGQQAPLWLQQSPWIPIGVAVVIGSLSYAIYLHWELPARGAVLRWTARLRTAAPKPALPLPAKS